MAVSGFGSGADGERGTIIPLVIGFTVILILLITAVINVSRVFLFHRDIVSAVDGAALAAASGVAAESVYGGQLGAGQVGLSQEAAKQRVDDYIGVNDLPTRFPGLESSVTVSGDTVTVVFSARAQVPFEAIIGDWVGGIPVTGTATAIALTP